jgi:HD-GYP domain-containing protein (c-di-GMP phosphodiesterase class II)
LKEAPAKVRVYVVACAAAACGAAFLAIKASPHFSWPAIIGFGALAFAVAQFPFSLPDGGLYDISFVITIAALLANGPGEAAIATVFATLSLRDTFHRPPIRNVFNASQLVLTAALGGVAYVRSGGFVGAALTSQSTGYMLFRHAFLPLLAATATTFFVNTFLVSEAIALSEGRSFASVWRRGFSQLLGNYTAFALLGLLIGVLKTLLDWASVLFVLMPLLVARQAFQAAFAMQGAYDDTVKGLVAAIEAKDPYTRGHAQRVAQLSEMTARAYGLSEERCRAIRYSALMHDVGKLGVLSRVLKKPGKLTPEEYEHMKVHPEKGVEIVQEIDLLQEAIDGVRHHHERMDGHGYPGGLVGDQIPLFARLIMVCDAFDAMTSTRVYRVAKTIDEAFVELRRCAGTQFDEASLDALEKAVARNGWEPIGREELEQGPVEMSKGPTDGTQIASI